MSDPSQPHRPDYHSLKSAPPPEEVAQPTHVDTNEQKLEHYKAELDRMSDDDVMNAGILAKAKELHAKGYRPQEILSEQVKAGQTETLEDVKQRLLADMKKNLELPAPEDDPPHPPHHGR